MWLSLFLRWESFFCCWRSNGHSNLSSLLVKAKPRFVALGLLCYVLLPGCSLDLQIRDLDPEQNNGPSEPDASKLPPAIELLTVPFDPSGPDNNTFIFQPATSEANLSYQCSLDGGAFQSCASPWTLSGLSPGIHSVQIRSLRSSSGATGPTSNFAWTVMSSPGTVVEKTIGTNTRDFTTLQAWENARNGDLTSRALLAVQPGVGTFSLGETVTGPSGCSGIYRPEDEARTNGNLMTLDNLTGTCAPGETLTGGTSSATAIFQSVLSSGGTIEKGLTYKDSTFTRGLMIDGSTTDASRFMWLLAAPGNEPNGTAGTGVVIDPDQVHLEHVIDIRDPYTRISGLEITGWPNTLGSRSWEGVHVAADQTLLEKLIIHNDDSPTNDSNADAINLNDMASSETVIIRNCLIYSVARGGINYQTSSHDIFLYSYNNTIVDTCLDGLNADFDCGIHYSGTGTGTINVSNTISINNNKSYDGFVIGSTAINGARNVSSGYSATGTDAIHEASPIDLFVDPYASTPNFHLKSGSIAAGSGVSLIDQGFYQDLAGTPRNTIWDIGALKTDRYGPGGFYLVGFTGDEDPFLDHKLTSTTGDVHLYWTPSYNSQKYELTLREQGVTSAHCGPYEIMASSTYYLLPSGCMLSTEKNYEIDLISYGEDGYPQQLQMHPNF